MENVKQNKIPSRNRRVVAQAVESELVLILPDQGKVKVINETGSRIWSWIDGIHTVQEIADLLHQEYQVELEHARQDVDAFLQELSTRKLIGWLDESSGE